MILGKANAFIDNSAVEASGVLGVSLNAANTAGIDSVVKASAATISVGLGGSTGAFAIGFSLAQNLIGWSDVNTRNPVQVHAYINDADIIADNGLSLTAVTTSTIDATVQAASLAVGLSSVTGGALAGSGLTATNKIATEVKTYIDDDPTTASAITTKIVTIGGAVNLCATDESTISSNALAAAVAASLAGSNSGALAIGVSLASNVIDNEIDTCISNTDSILTDGGDVVLLVQEQATITATSFAAAFSATIGGSFSAGLQRWRCQRPEHDPHQDERLHCQQHAR